MEPEQKPDPFTDAASACPAASGHLREYFEREAEPRGWTAEAFCGMAKAHGHRSSGSFWRHVKAEVEG